LYGTNKSLSAPYSKPDIKFNCALITTKHKHKIDLREYLRTDAKATISKIVKYVDVLIAIAGNIENKDKNIMNPKMSILKHHFKKRLFLSWL
jgi:hypothetical protein